MKRLLSPGSRSGQVRAPSSKSQLHRLLICAALSRGESEFFCTPPSGDVRATLRSLRALGAEIRERSGSLRLVPIRELPGDACLLPCGESGATLRLLLPLVGALGVSARFQREGRLPLRPLAPLTEQLSAHGMRFREEGSLLFASGRLQPGCFCLPGNVSSQFISALLLALPLLEGESRLRVTGAPESAPYIRMTEDVLRQAGVTLSQEAGEYRIPGGQRPELSGTFSAEGDWSGAALFLCLGALSPRGVLVRGLDLRSLQGDRAILELLRRFGAHLEEMPEGILCRRAALRPLEIDASSIPDLVPALSVLAAGAVGDSVIRGAGRLRFKESDRLCSTVALLCALGGRAEGRADALVIHGTGSLRGGPADSAGDHRIAMAAALAASLCREPVELEEASCVAKSYPRFWEDFDGLEAEGP